MSGWLDVARHLLHQLLALPPQGTPFAARVDDLQYVELSAFWLLGLVVSGFAAVYLLKYYRRGNADTPQRTVRVVAPLWLELSVSGLLLMMFVGWWVWGFSQYADSQTARDDAYEVYVTAKQWVWKFDYPNGRSTAGALYLPQGRDVRLLITSRDVIHSFFVPDFRVKRDAVPGRYLTLNFRPTAAGPHDVLCAEFCGPGHSRMWATVVVLPAAEFDQWVATGEAPEAPSGPEPAPPVLPGGQTSRPAMPGASLAARGEEVATQHGCFQCHSVDGSVRTAPTWRDLWGRRERLRDGDSVTVDAAYITESMMDPGAKIVAGFKPLMPSFQGQIDPSEVAALIEYIRSLSSDTKANR